MFVAIQEAISSGALIGPLILVPVFSTVKPTHRIDSVIRLKIFRRYPTAKRTPYRTRLNMPVKKQTIPLVMKVALYHAHDRRCIYCRELFRFNELEIEHILPQKLKENVRELERLLEEYGLDTDFDLEGYGNLLPNCSPCNSRKGGMIFEREAAHFYLAIAKRALDKVKKEEKRLTKTLEVDNLLAALGLALQKGLVTKDEITTLIESFGYSNVNLLMLPPERLVLTFGTNVVELIANRSLPNSAPRSYAELCDWLEVCLTNHLASISTSTFYYPEASARNGETLSVRLAFVNLDIGDLEKFQSEWWEILEVAYFSDIYDLNEEWFGPDNES